jgi:hypothetical protein
VPVHLESHVTEVGTLELWCVSRDERHRWKLELNIRERETTTPAERDAGIVRLPWNAAPDLVAGVFARDEGALVPARQVASAKSWLSNARVDRRAALLPWAVSEGPRLSPVEASARILAHLREAWNHVHADRAPLERQPVVLTVPASFDEEARELTVEAARAAGLQDVTLLEEPLAALYAWIATNRKIAIDILGERALILVCDVGGGTTDFSLIRAGAPSGGELTFERIAIGEHLLLGGDNLDLALAVRLEQRSETPPSCRSPSGSTCGGSAARPRNSCCRTRRPIASPSRCSAPAVASWAEG